MGNSIAAGRTWLLGWALVGAVAAGGGGCAPPSEGQTERTDLAQHRAALGLPNQSYTASELFKPLSIIRSTNASGAARGHGHVAMHKGYLAVIYARDSGQTGGGFSFWDISDPRNPVKAFSRDENEIREPHGWGFSSSYAGDYVVLQSTSGIQFWDWTNPLSPVRLSALSLPGVLASDYASGAWWAFWQAPYVYVGGSGNGIYVVDASNPSAPVLVRQVPTSQTGGFKIGPVFAVGNLLVGTNMDQAGYATLDISDPTNPTLLQATTSTPIVYASLFNGNRIFGAGGDGRLHLHSVSDTGSIASVSSSPVVGGKGGYLTVHSGYALMGSSDRCGKIDYRNETSLVLVGTATSALANRDEDFCSVLGNLAFAGDDHGVGSALFPHSTSPDTTGPWVTMVNPADGKLNRALTSRVGITFSEEVDVASLNAANFIVRPLGGAALPGKYSTQMGIANFSPDAPLATNTTYEIVLPAGGVKDVAGNAIATTFTAMFSTGSTLGGGPLSCTVDPTTPVPDGQTANLAANATGSGTIEYSFNFGDGSPATPFSTTRTASHAYSAASHYTVVVTVRNATEQATCSRVQTVHEPLTAARPTASSTIVFDGSTNAVWAVNADNDTVTAIDASTNTKRFEVNVGRHPRTLARAPDGTIWVVNQADATVSVLNGTSGALVTTISLPRGSLPYGVAFSPNGTAGYVTLQGTGKLVKLDPTTRAITATLDVTQKPRGIAISGDSSRILVTRFVSPDAQGEVVEVSASTFTKVRTFALAIDPGPDSESSGRGLPNYLTSLAISPDGRSAWIPSKKDNIQRGQFRDGNLLTFETTVRTITSVIDLTTNQEALSRRRDLNDRDMAQALAFGKYGDWVFVLTQGTNTLEVFDAYSGQTIGGASQVGQAPQGVAFNADFTRLYVNGFLSRDVTVYDVSGFVDSSSTTVTRLATISTVASEKLSANVLSGRRIFYNAADRRMNRDGYISCASCHLDGDNDGRVWDFTQRGEGLRSTISLLGRRGTGMGRVHWTANFDEIQDFENDMRNAFGGTGFMTDAQFNTGTRSDPLGDPKAGVSADLDALSAFVTSLSKVDPSPYRNADGTMTADALAGKTLFENLGCNSCHSGADFTDSSSGVLHNVGTIKPSSGKRIGQPLTGLDTPTLKGVWATAPYLHDGSAATLLDVLTTANPNGQHGATGSLTSTELNQLVAYMQQLEDAASIQVNITSVSSGRAYVTATAEVGATYYIDRTFTISGLSANLAGNVLIKTANDDKSLTTASHLTFTVDRPARVFVGMDARTTSLPAWLDGTWTLTSETLQVTDSPASPMSVYRKDFPAGSITLGANMQSPAAGMQSHYALVVAEAPAAPPPPPSLSVTIDFVSSGKAYTTGTAQAGETYYIDRTFTINSLSATLTGQTLIKTANDDKALTTATHLKFTVNLPVVVYVGMDKRTSTNPAWLDSSWTLTSETWTVGDSSASPFKVYRKSFAAGQITLGANKQAPGSGMKSHYSVIVVPQ